MTKFVATMNNTLLAVLAAFACCVFHFQASADEVGVAYRQAMGEAVRAAAGRVLPSVVTIEIIGVSEEGKGEVEQDAPTSGVIVDPSGYVLGSSIVVRRPSATILVVTSDGTRHTADVIARDHHRDLVLLKIEPKKTLKAIGLKYDAKLQIGMTTIAVGRYGAGRQSSVRSGGGQQSSDSAPMVSTGILSAIGRLDGIALQTDARVSPALYGGPLVDLHGNTLGVLIPAIAEGGAEDATSWYDSGIAFAIPSEVIENKLDRLKAGQDIRKGLIGIVAKSQDANDAGTEIAAVRSRSPAETAGIKPGDHVVSVDGKAVRRHQEIRQVLGSFDAGESVSIKIRRDDKELDLEITLTDTIEPLQPQRLGIAVSEIPGEGDDDEKAASVAVDAVIPGSPAEGKLQVDDTILRIGEAAIDAAASLRRQMISAEPSVPLNVTYLRDGKEATVQIVPDSIAGPLPERLPKSWIDPGENDWVVEKIKLPDAANVAAFVAPSGDDQPAGLGLLVLLLSPAGEAADATIRRWQSAAQTQGVVVCAIEPEDSARWQPKEVEIVAKFAASVQKKASIDSSAVAVAAPGSLQGGKPTAADSMALAVAISQSKTFFGVAVSSETRPPAVRLRENQPSASLQVLLPVATKEDLPSWGTSIADAGYPIVLGGELDRAALLRWVRLLQSI